MIYDRCIIHASVLLRVGRVTLQGDDEEMTGFFFARNNNICIYINRRHTVVQVDYYSFYPKSS